MVDRLVLCQEYLNGIKIRSQNDIKQISAE